MNLNAVMKLEAGGFTGPLSGARSAFSGFTSLLGSAIAPLAALAGGIGLVGLGVMGLKRAVAAAAADESLTAKLTVLTRDAKVAASLLADLNKYSDDTPFEPEPIMKAGVALVAAKFAAKDVLGILKDMGDLASGGVGDLNANLEEITSAFARLKSGGSGEAMEILRRFGIGLDDLKGKGLKFDAGGQLKSGAEDALAAVRAVIQERFGGTMEAMAQTTEGLWSTLQGNIGAAFREFGAPLLDPIKQALNAAIGYSGILTAKAKEWGQALAQAALVVIEIFKAGQIGTAAGLALKVGFGMAVNFLVGALKGAFVAAVSLLADGVAGAMKLIGNANAFKGIEVMLRGIGGVLSGEIKKALVDGLSGISVMGSKLINDDDAKALREAAENQSTSGSHLAASGASMMANAMAGSGSALAESLIQAWDKFTFKVKDANIIDTSKAQAELAKIIEEAKAKIAASKDAAADVPNVPAANDPSAVDAATKHGKGVQDGDRLAKVGLMVGATGTWAEAARKTADNTAMQLKLTQKLIEILGRPVESTGNIAGTMWA